MEMDRLDHVVLTVADVERSRAFYRDVLGMEALTFGGGRTALRFGAQRLHLHLKDSEPAPHAHRPTVGAADLCLLTATPMATVRDELAAHGVEVIEGPIIRQGAVGPILSVYVRDPDGNLVEIANPETEDVD